MRRRYSGFLTILITSFIFILINGCSEEKQQIEFSAAEKDWLNQTNHIVFAVDDTYPPLNYRDRHGEITGLNIDLIKIIEDKIGIPIKLEGSDWNKALDKAMNHEVDGIINATPLDERKHKLSFSNEFTQDPQALICRKEEIKGVDFSAYQNSIIAAKRNSIQLNLLKTKIPERNIIEINTLLEGLELLSRHEVDGVYDDLAPLYHLILDFNLHNVKVAFIEYSIEGATIGIRKDKPLLLSAINKAIKSISDEERNKIKGKWLQFGPEYDYTNIYIAISVLLIIGVVIIIWNRSLRTLVKKRTKLLKFELEERKKAEAELEKYKNDLEIKVKVRTEEIEVINEELRETNDELQATNERQQEQKEELENTLEKLKETQSRLLQSEKMASLGVLAAGIAHEINNPLNFIQAGIAAIEQYLERKNHEDYEKLQTLIDGAKTGVLRASDIITSLNHFSRQDKSISEACDIHAIINNCLVVLQNQLKNRIEVKTNLTHEKYILHGNEGRLHQAILNILNNASQAIKGKGEINIVTKVNNKRLRINVMDSGCGISKENISKITDPFFTTKSPGEGAGLGLSITYSIIEEHNGKLNFKSIPDQGTMVTIDLPLT